MAAAKRWTTGQTPVGILETAEMSGMPKTTVRSLSYRGKLPEPEALVSGNPTWQRATIEQWLKERKATTSA